MSQEAWILKCYLCEKFQVQLKKKAKKWKCSVCGAKQDLMKVYFTGQPRDCRINVQNMNLTEGKKLEKLKEKYINNEDQNMYYYGNETMNHLCNELPYEEDEVVEKEALAEIDEGIQTDERQISFECNKQNNLNDNEKIQYQQVFVSRDDFNVNFYQNTFHNYLQKQHTSQVRKYREKNRSNEDMKANIFESNCDFDESLDF